MLRQESAALQKVGYAVLRNRVDRYGNTAVAGLAHGEKKLETPRCGRDARRGMFRKHRMDRYGKTAMEGLAHGEKE